MKKFLLLFLLASPACAYKAVVVVPVADLRSEPCYPPPGQSDDKLQTQLLFGETVEVLKSNGDWLFVRAAEQQEFSTRQKWEGYPGWVLRQALKKTVSPGPPAAVTVSTWTPTMQPETAPDIWLTLGSYIRSTGKTDYLYVISTPLGDRCLNISVTRPLTTPSSFMLRSSILKAARQMLGVPYLWGGLTVGASPQQSLVDKRVQFGVDCSGLVHLCYRLFARTVSRDSLEQWMKSEKIKRNELMPADLVFSAKAENPTKISHVALYAGDGQLIEAPQTGLVVRTISFKDKFGKDLAGVESGDRVGDRYIYFGRYIQD